jgi:hypothetical protein
MLGLGDAVYYQRVPETSYDRGTIDPRIVNLISVRSAEGKCMKDCMGTSNIRVQVWVIND